MIAVSQHLTRSHGQGKINLELLLRLHERGQSIDAYSTWLEDEFDQLARFNWRRINVHRRTPTNWLRCELFRKQAEWSLRGKEVAINNGAAAIVPSQLSIAMFVHGAWYASPWHPRHGGGLHSKFLGAFNAHQSRLEKRAFKMASTVVALSEVVRGELIEFCNIPPERIFTIPPGVDTEAFQPPEADGPNLLREACGVPVADDRPLLLFVGEIRSARKNLDLVLEAVAQRPESLLAVIGSTEGSPYPAIAMTAGIADRVFFLGQRNNVSQLMPHANAFVFPTHYEPFGLVVTEAMASGLPVVVTRQAGAAFAVDHEQSGWLLNDGADLEGLLAAIDRLVDPSVRASWGLAARRRMECLTWDAMTDEYQRLLNDIT